MHFKRVLRPTMNASSAYFSKRDFRYRYGLVFHFLLKTVSLLLIINILIFIVLKNWDSPSHQLNMYYFFYYCNLQKQKISSSSFHCILFACGSWDEIQSGWNPQTIFSREYFTFPYNRYPLSTNLQLCHLGICIFFGLAYQNHKNLHILIS